MDHWLIDMMIDWIDGLIGWVISDWFDDWTILSTASKPSFLGVIPYFLPAFNKWNMDCIQTWDTRTESIIQSKGPTQGTNTSSVRGPTQGTHTGDTHREPTLHLSQGNLLWVRGRYGRGSMLDSNALHNTYTTNTFGNHLVEHFSGIHMKSFKQSGNRVF